ncbi:hypothetical protein TNCV_4531031 [Trichonephila clavipes]|nr:hypothetical protein TNCV_4531031 [Trichonephila clavipes]
MRYLLHVTYTRKWIVRAGPVARPARSLDLNHLDFFFCSHLKSLVYKTLVATVEDLPAPKAAHRSLCSLHQQPIREQALSQGCPTQIGWWAT